MPSRELPEEVVRFNEGHIDAYEQLEVLLLLRARGTGLTSSELAEEVGMEPEAAESAAEHLVEHGLLRWACMTNAAITSTCCGSRHSS